MTFFTCDAANDFSMLQMIRLFSRDFFFLIRLFSTRDFYAISLFGMFHLFYFFTCGYIIYLCSLFFFHASSFYTIRFACVYLCICRGWHVKMHFHTLITYFSQSYVKCMAFFIRVKKKNIYRHVIKVNVFLPYYHHATSRTSQFLKFTVFIFHSF